MAPRPRSVDLKLGIFERLRLVPIFAAVLGKTCWAALTGRFKPKHKRPSSFARLVGYTAIRTLVSKNSSRTEQALAPGTDEQYLTWCKQANVQPATESLKDGTTAYWVGSRDAEYVWIYFHGGGGYSMPAYTQHFAMLHSLITDLNTATSSSSSANQRPLLSALVLHYDVAPWGAYPRQLAQAALLLNHALHALHLAPSHLLLGGDSAGGNLALALLSHLLHPHRDPAVPRVALPLAQKIRAVALISPWVSFDTETASFERNASRDVVTPGALARWATVFLGGRPTDEYNEPVDVPAGWWRGLGERVVGDVLFLAGEYEVLLDGILNCAESVRNEWARGGGGGGARGEHGGEVALVVVEEEAHVSCWLDTLVGFGFEELGMYRELREWLRARLLEGRGK